MNSDCTRVYFKKMTSIFFAAIFFFLGIPSLLGKFLRLGKVFPLVFLQLMFGLFISESGLLDWLKIQNMDLLNGALSFSLQGLGWLGVVIVIALTGGESMAGSGGAKVLRFVPISLSGFFFTSTVGSIIGYFLVSSYPELLGRDASRLIFSLTIGLSLSVTALPVLISILRDTGLVGSPVGNLAVNCAMLDDVWMWLGIVFLLSFTTSSDHSARLFLFLALYVGLMFFVLKPGLIRWYRSRTETPLNVVLAFVSVICFSAMLTEVIGLHSLFGAFIGGVIFPRNVIQGWRESLMDFSQWLLLPFYFILAGIRLHFDAYDLSFWLLTAMLTTVAVVGKFLSVFVSARFTGLPWRECGVLGCLMQCKGLMELVAINIFLQAGIISTKVYSSLAMMAVFSTLITAPTIRIIMRRKEMQLIRRVDLNPV